MRPSHTDVVVVGTGEAALVARALGISHTTYSDAVAVPPRVWLAWGPIDAAHELHVRAPRARIAWRVDGLDLPLAARDHGLLTRLDRIVVADASMRRHLRDNDARCVAIEPLPSAATRRTPSARVTARRSAVIIGADARTVGGALVSLKQLLDGGLHRCDACGRVEAAAFDPSSVAFAAPTPCRCGGSRFPLPPPPATWIVAIRGTDDAGATAMSAWLDVADRVAVVAETDVAVDVADVVLDTSTGIDPGWGCRLAADTGARSISAMPPRGTGSYPVGTRTESDAVGRTRHTIDPVDLHRVLTDLLIARGDGIGAPDEPHRTGSSEAEIVDAWRDLLSELVTMDPPAIPLRPLRSPVSARR